jgi:serpin B
MGALVLYERKPGFAVASPLDSYTDFSIDLASRIGLGERNTAISPYSVYIALLMLTEGAGGDTKDELMRAMRISSLDEARNWFNSSIERFTGVERGARAEVADSVWVKEGFPVSEKYLEVVRKYYLAEVLSFRDPADAVPRINGWISNRTNGLIDKVVDGLDPRAVIVLVNTIYFKANWTTPFERVEKGDFHSPDGIETADYLRGRVKANYLDSGDYVALALSYSGTDVKFVVLMPKGDLKGFLSGMGREKLLEIFEKLFNSSESDIDLSLPKFDIDSGPLDLESVLVSMGMKKIFIPGEADLSPMVEGSEELCVDKVLHRARVKVDLYGTEAAAATSVIIRLTAMPSQEISVKIDRPFAFFLVDPENKAILFAGSFVHP